VARRWRAGVSRCKTLFHRIDVADDALIAAMDARSAA
jgi:hypothetical protein